MSSCEFYTPRQQLYFALATVVEVLERHREETTGGRDKMLWKELSTTSKLLAEESIDDKTVKFYKVLFLIYAFVAA